MADTKISALTALDNADLAADDVLPIVDTNAVATKKITVANLLAGSPANPNVQQTDIGTAPNEIPLNQYLGSMAYQDLENLPIPSLGEVTTPLAGTEELAVVQSGTTKQVSVNNLTAGKDVPMDIATVTTRLLVGTTNSTPGNGNTLNGVTAHDTAIFASRANPAVYLNRNTTDGQIVSFRRAGTEVGLIEVSSTNGTSYKTGGVNLLKSGIDFSADGQAAGMTSELLDDYEEGQHSATLTPSTSGTITLRSGYFAINYTKIGRTVNITGHLNVVSVSSPVGTSVSMSLPFAVASFDGGRGMSGGCFAVRNDTNVLPIRWSFDATTVLLDIDASTIGGGADFKFSFNYQAA